LRLDVRKGRLWRPFLHCYTLRMVTQPTPQVTADDVERVVRRDFPADDYAAIMGLLVACGTARVQLAVLKLASGDAQKLQRCIAVAKLDYRDVLRPAEYPTHGTVAWGTTLSDADRGRMYESDWRQYEEWLKMP
jgi:hypothetical protein